MDIYIIKLEDKSTKLANRLSVVLSSKEHYNLCKYRSKAKLDASDLDNLHKFTNINTDSLTKLFNKI